MKRIILVVFLVVIAGVAGVVRSHSRGGSTWPLVINGHKQSAGDVRDEIRKSYELAPGTRVEVSASQEVLNRRKITIDNTPSGLIIRGEKTDGSFLSRMFGSSPTEHVTLKLPRQISLLTRGVNGSVNVGEIDGAVEVHGINGKVDIAQASGSAEFNGINGNISVGLKQLDKGVDVHGINGNIELRLGEAVNADLDAHGMNGKVTSDLPNVVVDKSSHGSYSAQIGKGGTSISASGINGNIRLTRMIRASTETDESKSGS